MVVQKGFENKTVYDDILVGDFRNCQKFHKIYSCCRFTFRFNTKETPDDLKFHDFRKGVTLAMCQWELISNVRFRYLGVARKKADILISYEKRKIMT